jgi:hypothetical protein
MNQRNGFHNEFAHGSPPLGKESGFLNLNTHPARLDAGQTAAYLGFKPHDIPILVAAGLLKPLGTNCPANAVKYFATVLLDEVRHDAHWLHRATDAVTRHWQGKNARKTKPQRGAA